MEAVPGESRSRKGESQGRIMKRILSGYVYDTEKAEEVGKTDAIEAGICEFSSDLEYWEAGLYRTKRGRWFLAGAGGPMTMFSTMNGTNCWGGGEKIIPVEQAEAYDFAERYFSPELVEKHFGEHLECA